MCRLVAVTGAPLQGHLNFLFLIGVAVVGGIAGAKLIQKLRIPQVVGYIIIGLLIGQSGLKLIDSSTVDLFEPLNYFALGIIGFLIGGELKFTLFKQYGKQFASILIGEGIAAFLLVGAFSTLLAYVFTADVKLSVALGVVLGAISSATDPATTVQVLWEYKTRGPLTTAATAVVALDDVLALTLYAIGTSLAGALMGRDGGGLTQAVGTALYEIGVSLAVGFAVAMVLAWTLARLNDTETSLGLLVGAVLLVLGISVALELDIILSSMAMGLALVNAAPKRTEKAFDLVKRFAPPIYVLFFVLVGARLKVSGMSVLAWLLVLVYIVGRSVGKISGAYFGACLSKAEDSVRKNLGLCLFAQGGVAIGLSIVASHRFDPHISSIIVLVVTTTTLALQLTGPFFVRMGVRRAEEVGLNITEEDLMQSFTVADVMDTKAPVITQGMSLRQIIELVSDTSSTYYPVLDGTGKLVGSITMDGIRKTFATQELSDWLVALDIMEPVHAKVTPEIKLAEAFELARQHNVSSLPVVTSQQDDKLLGVLDCDSARRSLSAEVLARQRKADKMR